MNDWSKLLSPLLLIGAWLGSFEWRLRGKISKDRFGDLQTRVTKIDEDIIRVESHIYDLLVAHHVKPSMEPPEAIRNNNKQGVQDEQDLSRR